MSLMLVGDIAYPYAGAVSIDDIEAVFKGKTTVGNLEGPVLSGQLPYDKDKYNIYSCPEVLSLLKRCNITAVSLANNHFCDFKQAHRQTCTWLHEHQLEYFGLADKKWSVVQDEQLSYALYGTYTFITGGNQTKDCLLNRFRAAEVLQEIRTYKEQHPERLIIIYIHWGYELADYPQPADREFARRAIDAGASAVIGHHPHVLQGVETYKHGVIAYSLGNFVLPQVRYQDKVLKYNTERVKDEMAIELSYNRLSGQLSYQTHVFYYDKEEGALLMHPRPTETLQTLTPYAQLDDQAYRQWFHEHQQVSRYPTYQTYDRKGAVAVNNVYIKGLKTLRKAMIMGGLHKPF